MTQPDAYQGRERSYENIPDGSSQPSTPRTSRTQARAPAVAAPAINGGHPQHVTIKLREGLPSMRSGEVLKLLWTENEASFAGEFFEFENMCSSPKPKQAPHPLIVIGGNRPAALKRVARFGDGWHPMNVSPEGVERRMEVIREEVASSGKLGNHLVTNRLMEPI